MKKIYNFLLNTLPRPLLIRLSYLFRVFSPWFYNGNNVMCPVCERSFSKFLSYGSNVAHRENVLCPYDLTLERHRLLWLYLKNETDFFSRPIHLLHIAPEQCFYDRFKKQKNLKYLTGDLVSPLAQLHFDLHSIPLENELFDVLICNHVLEHVEDPMQCLSEMYRVMKKGAWAILQVPLDSSRELTYEDKNITSPEEREKHFWQKDHVRLFGKDYPEWLKKAGFEVKIYNVQEKFDADFIQKNRLIPDELLYIAIKN
ncbi:MAG: methyltransferase domain-containing protein [Flavobacteriia bacterium]|nr:methyltransferase domain-containing protein [Flavobacteriia bacterium]